MTTTTRIRAGYCYSTATDRPIVQVASYSQTKVTEVPKRNFSIYNTVCEVVGRGTRDTSQAKPVLVLDDW